MPAVPRGTADRTPRGTTTKSGHLGPLVIAVGSAVSLVAGACSSSPARPSTSTAATTTTAGPSPAPQCHPPNHCPLQVAGKRDGLMIGTALKYGAARDAIQEREFSGITSEDEFLWSVIQPEEHRYDFTGSDRVVAFAQAHHKVLTATHFIWDPPALPSVLPQWVRDITDPARLLAVMRDHFTTLHRRYGGKVDRWDVVNEPIGSDGNLEKNNHFLQVLGPDYVATSFRMAAEIWPEAQLVLNQDLTEYLPSIADGLVRLVKQLLHAHVRVDRVGIQGHLFLGDPNFALVRQTMRRITALGVPVDISELDVPLISVNKTDRIDLAQQAARGAQMVETCLAVPKCESITFWGFDDGSTWLTDYIGPGTDPLLYDDHLRPKPLYRAVQQALLRGRRGVELSGLRGPR